LSTTNLTWIALGLNPGLCGEKLTYNIFIEQFNLHIDIPVQLLTDFISACVCFSTIKSTGAKIIFLSS
jgi:hypothetical protein